MEIEREQQGETIYSLVWHALLELYLFFFLSFVLLFACFLAFVSSLLIGVNVWELLSLLLFVFPVSFGLLCFCCFFAARKVVIAPVRVRCFLPLGRARSWVHGTYRVARVFKLFGYFQILPEGKGFFSVPVFCLDSRFYRRSGLPSDDPDLYAHLLRNSATHVQA